MTNKIQNKIEELKQEIENNNIQLEETQKSNNGDDCYWTHTWYMREVSLAKLQSYQDCQKLMIEDEIEWLKLERQRADDFQMNHKSFNIPIGLFEDFDNRISQLKQELKNG